MDTCRSCKAPLKWIRMVSGVFNPCEPEPRKDGNIRLLEDGRGEQMTALEAAAYEGPKYLSHFVNCPERKQWKRPKK